MVSYNGKAKTLGQFVSLNAMIDFIPIPDCFREEAIVASKGKKVEISGGSELVPNQYYWFPGGRQAGVGFIAETVYR